MKPPLFILALALIFAAHTNSFSQKDYREGYVIKVNGDSIPGLIAVQDLKGNGNSCLYKSKDTSQSELLSPLDIKAYGSVDGIRFDSKMIPIINGQVFAKTIVKGKMNLYLYNKNLYVETDKVYPLLNKKGKRGQYKTTLHDLMVDCGLNANKTKCNVKAITKLVQNYNQCKGEPSIKFKKTRAATKVDLYAFYGADLSTLKVNDGPDFKSNYSSLFGGGINLSSKGKQSKFFVNMEVAYINKQYVGYSEIKKNAYMIDRNDYSIEASFIRVPLGFGLRFDNRPQTPYMKFGYVQYYILNVEGNVLNENETYGIILTTYNKLDFKTKQQRGFWVSAGFDKNVWKKVSAFVECRLEITDGFIGSDVASKSFSQNVTAIVGFKF